jgi:hypothetical protein
VGAIVATEVGAEVATEVGAGLEVGLEVGLDAEREALRWEREAGGCCGKAVGGGTEISTVAVDTALEGVAAIGGGEIIAAAVELTGGEAIGV